MSSYKVSGSAYMEASIAAATPARMRLMLIDRAVETASLLVESWQSKETTGPNTLSAKLLDLINELLEGVKGSKIDSENELCGRIADLYIFLAKHLVVAEQISDHTAISEIKLVLELEAETWRAVCAQETGAVTDQLSLPAASGLNIQG